ncbi:MAG: hypothetical protein HY247_05590 [archaeon]|nr:MAG: hypothetical protein HY247_05590 [archaeon]
MRRLSYDYQLTYLHGASRDVIGEITDNRVRISLPSLIDNFERNLVDEVATTLIVILLHELSHWGDEGDYGNDFSPSPGWNEMLVRTVYNNGLS